SPPPLTPSLASSQLLVTQLQTTPSCSFSMQISGKLYPSQASSHALLFFRLPLLPPLLLVCSRALSSSISFARRKRKQPPCSPSTPSLSTIRSKLWQCLAFRSTRLGR